ncbi:hypothetical protein C8F04DRAFT_1074390 [Mycena alexandri]|uniref:MYND-type domain-containing protein n=1 Tax=Mycena alexandri TaxID=1745969 RepID=A0AAD6TDY4_9AGAR|nr:hypothetical protein C8F04DRAFT_1074390 [Mycena alexandri]
MSLDLLLFLFILLAILVHNWKSSPPTPSSSSNAKRPCIQCGKPTTLRCSRCHAAYYCSAEHMTSVPSNCFVLSISPLTAATQDWRNHRTACRKAFDALLFPVDGDRPLLVKIPYTNQANPDDGPYHDLDSPTLKRYINGALGTSYVTKLGSYGPALDHALLVIYHDYWANESRNQCIEELTGGRMGIAWAGNVVVLRQKGRLYSNTYESAKLEDIAAMTRFFGEHQDGVPYAF